MDNTVSAPCPTSVDPVVSWTVPSSWTLISAAEAEWPMSLAPEMCDPQPNPIPRYFGNVPCLARQSDSSTTLSMHSSKANVPMRKPLGVSSPGWMALRCRISIESMPRSAAISSSCESRAKQICVFVCPRSAPQNPLLV